MKDTTKYKYACEICGRKTFKKIRMRGYTLCSKHMHQLFKYGEFKDSIPRTNQDLNDYVIKDDIAIFNTYGQNNIKNGEFIIDREDVEKIKYKKWRLSASHVVTGQSALKKQRDVAHVIMGVSKEDCQNGLVVDHINGDPLDNRKKNLRVCTQSDNIKNKSFFSKNTSGFIGVSYDKKRNSFDSEIHNESIRCHLGRIKDFKLAVYKRFIAEILVFKQYANRNLLKRKFVFTRDISRENKLKMRHIVREKLTAKHLI